MWMWLFERSGVSHLDRMDLLRPLPWGLVPGDRPRRESDCALTQDFSASGIRLGWGATTMGIRPRPGRLPFLMQLQRTPTDPNKRGAALMLSFLVLIVILMICYQITRTTGIDRIEAQRTQTLTGMDYAISSAFLQVAEDLLADVEAEGGEEAAGGAAVDPMAGGMGADGGGDESAASSGGTGASDSQMDAWAMPQVTMIGEQEVRITVVDEDRKFNVLNMLVEDEEEANENREIVARILDNCREGTLADINRGDADLMSRVMYEHFTRRADSLLPQPTLLSDGDDPEPDQPAMPLSLREMVVLEPFQEQHFMDFFDADGERVHSIEQFLTIWTSPATFTAPDAVGGYEVNINTAPLAVLVALFDSRAVDPRLWDEILAYRNEPEELDQDEEEIEPSYDEFGNEVVQKKFFDTVDELTEVRTWDALEAEDQQPIQERLITSSRVFSIYAVARQSTAARENQILEFTDRNSREQYERSSTHLLRVVRQVVWRQEADDGAVIVPLLPWEVLGSAPLDLLDFPDDL